MLGVVGLRGRGRPNLWGGLDRIQACFRRFGGPLRRSFGWFRSPWGGSPAGWCNRNERGAVELHAFRNEHKESPCTTRSVSSGGSRSVTIGRSLTQVWPQVGRSRPTGRVLCSIPADVAPSLAGVSPTSVEPGPTLADAGPNLAHTGRDQSNIDHKRPKIGKTCSIPAQSSPSLGEFAPSSGGTTLAPSTPGQLRPSSA